MGNFKPVWLDESKPGGREGDRGEGYEQGSASHYYSIVLFIEEWFALREGGWGLGTRGYVSECFFEEQHYFALMALVAGWWIRRAVEGPAERR